MASILSIATVQMKESKVGGICCRKDVDSSACYFATYSMPHYALVRMFLG